MDEVPLSTLGHGPRARVSRSRFVFRETASLIELPPRESDAGCYYSCFVSGELRVGACISAASSPSVHCEATLAAGNPIEKQLSEIYTVFGKFLMCFF